MWVYVRVADMEPKQKWYPFMFEVEVLDYIYKIMRIYMDIP